MTIEARPLLGLALTLLAGTGLPHPAQADVTLPPQFSDHMVLQRDAQTPIWGLADPGEAVSVSFAGQKKTAVADAGGKWIVRLSNLAVDAKPQTLTVTGKRPGCSKGNSHAGSASPSLSSAASSPAP